MQSRTITTIAAAVALAAGLSACASGPYGPAPVATTQTITTVSTPVAYAQPADSVEYGRITNVQMIQEGPVASSANTTTGTIVGAVVGGALGNLVGGGTGRIVATVLGAVGGATVGNRLAHNNGHMYNTASAVHRVQVTTDQGSYREYDVSASADLRIGDRVRIENGVIYQG